MRRFLITLPVALALFLGVSVPVYAASANLPLLNPDFSIVPKECQACPCDYGGILQLAQNLMNAGIAVGIIAFLLVTVYAGANFMLNPTSPEIRSKARSMFINVAVGMVIVLASWLFVDFIMKILYNKGSSYGPWNEILAPAAGGSWCIQESEQKTIPGLSGSFSTGILGGGGYGGVAGTGSTGGAAPISVPASGDCSAAAIAQDWGSEQKGNLFACIINNESHCKNIPTTAPSQVSGLGSSAGGRYQVVMSTNSLNFPSCTAAAQKAGFSVSGNLNCASHFPRGYSDGSTGASACRAAQADPTCNTDAAKYLYAHGGVSHWLGKGDIGGKNQACVTKYGN